MWNTTALNSDSGFFGQSNNVRFRLTAYPSQRAQANAIADSYRPPFISAQTYPFRVRGIQPRVVDEIGAPMADALVYRVNKKETTRAWPVGIESGEAYFTDSNGYLAGNDVLRVDDQLVALAPITATHAYILYHTSDAAAGMSGKKIEPGIVQTLTVSADNPLYVFNLDVSLEWDARNDLVFMDDLEDAFREASDILYDITDGQVALGAVRVFHAKENWLGADVVIHASNNQRPRASLGGVVMSTVDDPLDDPDRQKLENAYSPGQVRMGPIWDPYGLNREELGDDWRNALAHELGHYLLFLPDNYLGVDLENGLIRKIDCPGSIMTDAYELRYRELLTSEEWAGSVPCQDTLAEHLTGRSDWETLAAFYDGIKIPESGRSNPGPSFLPLEITRLTSIDPLVKSTGEESGEELGEALDADVEFAPADAFPARYIDLRKGRRGPVTRFQEAQVYLIKSRAEIEKYNDDLTDDTIIFLGSTGSGDDRIKVRGAERGDRICAVQFGDEAAAGGCAIVTSRLTSLDLLDYPPEWRPAITVSPVTSRTVTISVSVPISDPLNVQLMPAYGPFSDTLSVRSPYTTMQVVTLPDSLALESADLSGEQALGKENYVHTATLTLPFPAFEGHVRVWPRDAPPGQEAFAAYFLSPDFVPEEAGFGPNNRGFGPNNRGFGPNNRGFGPNNRGFGPNNRGFGPNNRGFGPNNRGFGPTTRLRPQQSWIRTQQQRLWPEQSRFRRQPCLGR